MATLTSFLSHHHGLPVAQQPADELGEVEWPQALALKDGRWNPAPLEWLFGSFLLCMAIAALPLVGIRWTMPDALRLGAALADAAVLALPVALPLPFLFLGCAAALILQPRSRTPAAFAAFAAGVAIGLAAAHALLS